MKKRKIMKRIIKGGFLFIAMAIVLPLAFHSCQQDELLDLNAMYEQEGYESKAILFPYVPTVMFPEVFVGPVNFYPAKGKVQTQTVVLENEDFASFQSTFALVIQNGDGGSNTAQSVTVSVNGIQEFSSNNLRRDPLVVTRLIYDLGEFTAIDVEIRGKDGTYVTIWIEGTLAETMETFTDDRDGKTYKTVTLGSQTWMAENLAYLPELSALNDYSFDAKYFVYGYAGTSVEEAKATDAYKTYGALYSHGAATTTACPPGWRLPTYFDINTLEGYLRQNGYHYEGGPNDSFAKALADETNWNSSSVEGSPGWMPELNNSTGFSALPGGTYGGSQFLEMGSTGYYWISNLFSSEWAYGMRIFHDSPTIARYDEIIYIGYNARSVRCIKE